MDGASAGKAQLPMVDSLPRVKGYSLQMVDHSRSVSQVLVIPWFKNFDNDKDDVLVMVVGVLQATGGSV